MKNMEKFNFCLVWVRVNNLLEHTDHQKRLFLIVGNNNDKLYGFLSTCKIDEAVYYLQNEALILKIPQHNPFVGEMSLVMLNKLYEIDSNQILSKFYHLNYEQILNLLKRMIANKKIENTPDFIKEGLPLLSLPHKEGDVILHKNKIYYVESLLNDYVVCYKMSILPSENSIEVTMDYKKWFIDLTSTYFFKNESAKYHNYLYPFDRLQIESCLRKKRANIITKEIPTNIHELWIGSQFAYNQNGKKRMGIILDRNILGTHIITRMENNFFTQGTNEIIRNDENIEFDFRHIISEQKVMHLKRQQRYGDRND